MGSKYRGIKNRLTLASDQRTGTKIEHWSWEALQSALYVTVYNIRRAAAERFNEFIRQNFPQKRPIMWKSLLCNGVIISASNVTSKDQGWRCLPTAKHKSRTQCTVELQSGQSHWSGFKVVIPMHTSHFMTRLDFWEPVNKWFSMSCRLD